MLAEYCVTKASFTIFAQYLHTIWRIKQSFFLVQYEKIPALENFYNSAASDAGDFYQVYNPSPSLAHLEILPQKPHFQGSRDWKPLGKPCLRFKSTFKSVTSFTSSQRMRYGIGSSLNTSTALKTICYLFDSKYLSRPRNPRLRIFPSSTDWLDSRHFILIWNGL